MKTATLSTLTLEEIVAVQAEKQLDDDIFVFEIMHNEIVELRMNYPCKGNFVTTMLVMAGTAQVKVDFETATLEAGSLISTFPNNIIEFQTLSLDCHIIGILQSVESMAKVEMRMDAEDSLVFLSDSYSKFMQLDEEIFAAAIHILKRLAKINVNGMDKYYSTEIIWKYVTLFFYELATFAKRSYKQYKTPVSNSPRKEDLAIRFVGIVAKDFRIQREVNYYADQLHVSRKHLTRIIKTVYGLTPKQIIDGKVIAEAKVLLQKNELNIKEIMRELSFEDQPTFSKFFKKNTGFSPLIYRRHIDN
ncbi:helix-turn-helix domain-containing protein [Sphingobacterium tabacisoli]|uniref:Helix-turn-helix domain-containing protein n=1 Tax=Sphingobacterium tabacisoli TaxID=2044855 RepID=A0ABW5L9G4_9SPHI|nr:helix-turn-helix domain-containing protein [Sphingobacterium tabacisoli]